MYAQLVYAFELAQTDPRVAGLNLVAPEDHPTALHDYTLHIEMLGFLAAQYPGVHIALHAGELTLGLVPPEQLRFHIPQAVHIAKAQRIGHGVDISYEDDALALMATMRHQGVLVGICLTSAEPSAPCNAFLQANDRARMQWRLEQEFMRFEQLPWW